MAELVTAQRMNVLIAGIATARRRVSFVGPFERLLTVHHYWIGRSR